MLGFVKHLFKLQFLLILIAVFAGIYYEEILRHLKKAILGETISVHYDSAAKLVDGDRPQLFSKEQLATYNGENDTPIYLAILGSVYDVTRGKKHYGSGCAYNYFVGRDASVSFITGEFEKYDPAEADNVNTLKPSDLLSLANWKSFYDKDYTYKGKLIGRFYDATGQLTTYHHQYLALVEQAKDLKAAETQLRELFPDCNIEWSEQTGSHVWCTTSSGGKERQWVGYPRRLFEVGKESYRCACLRKEDLHTTVVMIKPYDNCEEFSHECYYKID